MWWGRQGFYARFPICFANLGYCHLPTVCTMPIKLRFPFVPKLIMLLGYVRADGSYSPSLGASSGGYCVHLINVDKLTTSYQTGLGLANYSGLEAYGKKSSDGKTFSWYYSTTSSSNGPNYQCNISGLTYHYAILG